MKQTFHNEHLIINHLVDYSGKHTSGHTALVKYSRDGFTFCILIPTVKELARFFEFLKVCFSKYIYYLRIALGFQKSYKGIMEFSCSPQPGPPNFNIMHCCDTTKKPTLVHYD